MQNFSYRNPTKIVFGKGTISQLGEETAQYGKKALMVCGGGSIKKNGVYEQAVESLTKAGIEIVEFWGVKPNPTLEHTREGIALAKSEAVDVIVAVGGGSVIDEGKAIAAGAASETDVWKFYIGEVELETAMPLISVLTLAATGTEWNGGTVITNEETGEKFGMIREQLHPKASILDPETTYSVNPYYTTISGVDAMAHLLEPYLTSSDEQIPCQDRMVEGYVRTLMETTEACLATPDDYQSRANLMWAASLAWNGLPFSGIGGFAMCAHLIGHSMSCLYDTAHGASLSLVFPAWLEYDFDLYKQKIAQMGARIFDLDAPSLEEGAAAAIESLRAWFKSVGAPTTFTEAGLPLDAVGPIAENGAHCSPKGGLARFDVKAVTELLEKVAK